MSTPISFDRSNGYLFILTERQKIILDNKGASGIWLDVFEMALVWAHDPCPPYPEEFIPDPLREWWILDLREYGYPCLGWRGDMPMGEMRRGAVQFVGNDVETPDVIFALVRHLMDNGATHVPSEYVQMLDGPYDRVGG